MPVGLKSQTVWNNLCALYMAALVSELPYMGAYLTSIQGDTLRSFKHAINSGYQLAVIPQHTKHTDKKLRDLCTGWASTADGKTK